MPGMNGRLTFQAGFQKDDIEDAKIGRKWEDGIFISYSPSKIIDKYCMKEQHRLAFAQMDYDTVHREIMDIKSCRTNIFTGTLGVIGAIGVAIVGILGTVDTIRWDRWLPFAAAIPTLLLTCSILSAIHKARGINERAGYIEALAEYLARGKVPEFFCGWPKASRVGKRCEIFKKMNIKQVPNLTCRGEPDCTELAKGFTSEYAKHVELKPDLLESFTSLSTHIYAGAYFISVVSVLTATMKALRTKVSPFDPVMYWLLVGIGAVFTGLFIILNVFSSKRDGARNKRQSGPLKWHQRISVGRLFKLYKHFAGFSLPVLIVIVVLTLSYGNDNEKATLNTINIIAVYGLGAVIAAACVSAGYSFYDKLYSLRRGYQSLERWRYIWKIRLGCCSRMIWDALPQPGAKNSIVAEEERTTSSSG